MFSDALLLWHDGDINELEGQIETYLPYTTRYRGGWRQVVMEQAEQWKEAEQVCLALEGGTYLDVRCPHAHSPHTQLRRRA